MADEAQGLAVADTLFASRGATFSACRLYRYRLWRKWADGPGAVFVMLNPSTADEAQNDPTIERCQRRTVSLGLSSITVVNLFAYRSTDPRALKRVADPVGPDNDVAIVNACAAPGSVVICGWGKGGSLQGRSSAVLRMLRAAGVRPLCLGRNSDGSPEHPLYVSYSRPLMEMPSHE